MSKSKPIVIAIDGPSASGKGSLAKIIADKLGLAYLNSGALYRGVALQIILAKYQDYDFTIPKNMAIIKNFVDNLMQYDLEQSRLFSEEVGIFASKIAKMQQLRDWLLDFQHNFISFHRCDNRGVVIDGRDIGTVVCPRADFKFFIEVSVKVRAERRYQQLKNNLEFADKKIEYQEILEQLKLRDYSDINRSNAPLMKAIDAINIVNEGREIMQVADEMISFITKSN